MSTVTEIIEAVKGLDVDEKTEFLTRLSEVDFETPGTDKLKPTPSRTG